MTKLMKEITVKKEHFLSMCNQHIICNFIKEYKIKWNIEMHVFNKIFPAHLQYATTHLNFFLSLNPFQLVNFILVLSLVFVQVWDGNIYNWLLLCQKDSN